MSHTHYYTLDNYLITYLIESEVIVSNETEMYTAVKLNMRKVKL